MKKLFVIIFLAGLITNCSSVTTCNGKSYKAGAGELSVWCAWQ